jgi:Mce-associated membrane protein
VYGYDHEDMQGSLETTLSLTTDEYAREFEDAWNNELQPVIDELRAAGEVELTDVYVTDVEGDRAKAVVSFNAVIRSTAGVRRLTGAFLQLDLQRDGGAWLVANYKLLATTDETLDTTGGAGGGGGGATPPTTAPGG